MLDLPAVRVLCLVESHGFLSHLVTVRDNSERRADNSEAFPILSLGFRISNRLDGVSKER